MPGSVSDEAFARAAQQAGVVTFDDLEAAKAVQAESAKKGVLVPLADVLVQQGVITAKTRESIEKKLQAQQSGGIRQLGQYKLLKKLGEGGMGAVYLADDTHVGRQVAVKVLAKKHAGDAEFVTRFRREARAAGSLNHVNIVSAYVCGEDQGHHYLAMEYCDGEPLDKILKRDRVLPWNRAIKVTLQVARGLKHAHEHAIVHRDIKPSNIMICRPLRGAGVPPGAGAGATDPLAEGFVAKILDLGLSKIISGNEQSFYTQTGVAVGTPHYISPEQAKGEKSIDGRADIYSLGATFYHLVTGQTPFQASTPMAIMYKQINEQLPNPQDIVEDRDG
ncbi:MAG: serine/threonine-protein kinase [Planctomycetota bacterium]|nr:serine/threonine-protein kinase [Planctomycetota bacterium]